MNFFKTLIGLFCSFSCAICTAQGIVSGKVSDGFGGITGVSVYVQDLRIGTQTNREGMYEIQLPEGSYIIAFSYLGFNSAEKDISVINGQNSTLDMQLSPSTNTLSTVKLVAKTQAEKIKEQAFEVEVVEAASFKNLSGNVNSIMESIPGVHIRKSGGLGSDFNFSLNGLSGKKVKFFIDDIPIGNFGSSFSLNNFPVNLIERIEIYKGVVPIKLGSDALGGAINIITATNKESFIDASFSTGSFNTHIGAVNGQYILKNNFILKLSSFYNYSDNNYEVDGIVVRDDLGNSTGLIANNIERFHDAYSSQLIDINFGVVEKVFADKLFLGFTSSSNKNEIQHPFIGIQTPYGQVYSTNDVKRGSLEYQNNFLKEKLKLKLYASIAKNTNKLVDTSSFDYDWFGNITPKSIVSSGELSNSNTLFEFHDDVSLLNGSAQYEINNANTVELNFINDYISRVGEDPLNNFEIPFSSPNTLSKSILGLAYNLNVFERKWENTFFGKGYYSNYRVVNENLFEVSEENRLSETKEKSKNYGYGFASTYSISNAIRIKASFEKTFRIPDGYELFGDGILLTSSTNLRPEKSINYNLGLIAQNRFNKFLVKFDGNFFHRNTTDFINLTSVGIFSTYQNISNANTTGGEVDLALEYDKTLSFNVNSTYQSIRNKNREGTSGLDYLDNARLNNIPYFFGNAGVTKFFKSLLTQSDLVSLSWSSNYVHDFPLISFTGGATEERLVIPTQFSHDLNIGYSFGNGKYNLSLAAINITDENLFDNFNIPQPGRAFYIKLRYFISNKK